MSEFSRIEIAKARKYIENGAVLFDIRDEQSFNLIHHTQAIHLTNDTVRHHLNRLEFDTPILIVCYHGNSSQGVAQFFADEGFLSVFSVDGGMAAWAQLYLEDCIEGPR